MGSVLCAAASFCWSNCAANCRFLGGFVCLGDMAALEDERLKNSFNPKGQCHSSFRVNEFLTVWGMCVSGFYPMLLMGRLR